ncbi:hypothetical protein GU926_13625 [Nibribacter ruber]|uniref:DUF2268 domain-containing protein n=1 Tax=Nibribacter ruber TaxID=2698458 RepID=A0A6P1NX11_9BACT|nr:DUF2268 domain-containing putative Zn-dependent protease [Nibribacter ruber]QHL88416.1 hypothetical protein GU926_13625 [Nibribacter ruber]
MGQDKQSIVTTDIANFWQAYDKVTSTKDSAQQYAYLDQLFLSKGSPGLKAIMEVKDYTAQSYIEAMNQYPLFWNSIRANTQKADGFGKEIEKEVTKLRKLYPSLRPSKVYFTIGAFQSGGTTLQDRVLIGSELSLVDKSVITSEFPKSLNHLTTHFQTNPINDVVFTNVHEYVHTQQKATTGDNLLANTVMEGVAEFVTVKATGKKSSSPAIKYGSENAERVRQRFAKEAMNLYVNNWFYNTTENEFNTRDMGYYVGYAICEKYYNKAKDKKQAIKEMIELDFNNEQALHQFIEQSGYFTQTVGELKDEFDKNRPAVTHITQFKNQDRDVNPSLTTITIHFSTQMRTRGRNFEMGPLGMENLMRVKKFVGFSEDGTSATIEVELKPNHRYQLVVGDQFRSKDNIALKPYLIDFTTSGK